MRPLSDVVIEQTQNMQLKRGKSDTLDYQEGIHPIVYSLKEASQFDKAGCVCVRTALTRYVHLTPKLQYGIEASKLGSIYRLCRFYMIVVYAESCRSSRRCNVLSPRMGGCPLRQER